MNGLRIIIPSRNRLRAIRVSSGLFPYASIVVAEEERLAYAAVVDPARIVTHQNLRGFANVFNWCIDNFQEEELFFVDDDVSAVRRTFKKNRRLPPDEIEAVIENSMQVLRDVSLTTCCFARTFNITIIDPVNCPMKPVQPVCVAFGIRGAARTRRYDASLTGRADVDWTIRTLIKDRAIFCDTRFFFANRRIFGGEGGNVGIVDAERRKKVTEELERRYSRYVTNRRSNLRKSASVLPLRIRISRYNPTALS